MTRLDTHTTYAEPNFEYIHALYRKGRLRLTLLPIITLFVVAISFLAFLVWPRSYTASATIAPGSSLDSSVSMRNSTSGLAALTGSSLLSGSTVSPFDMYLDVLGSRRLARSLSERDSFLQIVFWRQWDSAKNRWKEKDGLIHAIGKIVKPLVGLVPKEHPDVDDLSLFLSQHLLVATKESQSSPLSSIMTVSFTYRDPQEASRLLNTILTETDGILRASRRDDVRSRITYLNKALQTADLADQHQALTNILSSQEEEYTVLQADKLYAVTLIDPPFASPVPSSPKFFLFIGAGILISLLSWFGLIIFAPEQSQRTESSLYELEDHPGKQKVLDRT